MDVDAARFEELVGEALDGLPAELGRQMRNVAVVVEDDSDELENGGILLGLYEGVPLTQRDANYTGYLPDRITIYRHPICAISADEAEVVRQVRITVVHEVAHHFGIDDARLTELGW